MRWSSLLVAAATAAPAFAGPVAERYGSRRFPDAITRQSRNFQYFGANEAGAEFGGLPGVAYQDYTWPLASSIDVK